MAEDTQAAMVDWIMGRYGLCSQTNGYVLLEQAAEEPVPLAVCPTKFKQPKGQKSFGTDGGDTLGFTLLPAEIGGKDLPEPHDLAWRAKIKAEQEADKEKASRAAFRCKSYASRSKEDQNLNRANL